MKPIKYIGVALVAAAALGAVACNNESLNGPDFNSTNSSAVEKPKPQSSSSESIVVMATLRFSAFSFL